MTATLGESSVSKDVEVKDSYVASIEITSKEALTNDDGDEAYIYYDVKNQYGESIRSSENIEWTTSPACDNVDRNAGRITIKKTNSNNNNDKFIYGSAIYVTGVHVKTGTAVNASINVGMAQAADSVEFKGFLNKNDTTKAPIEKLPADFAKDTYVLLYRTLDQNGNALEVDDYTGDGKVTFISDNPQLIKSPLAYDDKKYTVNGERYAAIAIEPGMWVDRGGEVNITWVANKTGKRDSKNFVVDANGMLKSLVLSAPVDTVADGDQDVKIPYTATDTNGNNIQNYSTIVRSTNTLTLNASVGVLKVKEENDGTAGIYWSDKQIKAGDYSDRSAFDNQDRPVSLTTIVLGGESSNMLFNVSDMRRPTTIDAVTISDTWVSGDSVAPTISDWSSFRFIDQYGKAMVNPNNSTNDSVKEFFKQGATDTGINKNKYGIKVNVTGGKSNVLGINSGIYTYNAENMWNPMPGVSGNNLQFNFVAEKNTNGVEVKTSDSVKYSIAKIATDAKDINDSTKWDDVSKVRTETYTVVPFAEVSGLKIDGLNNRLKITTKFSEEFNGTSIGATNGAFMESPEGNLTVKEVASYGDGNNITKGFTVSGTVDGKTVNIPRQYFVAEEKSAFSIEKNSNRIDAVSAGAIKWSDLYNVNDTMKTRKDAIKDLRLLVGIDSDGDGIPDTRKTTLKKSVTISDAMSGIAEVRFTWDGTPDSPNMTVIKGYKAEVYDQYTEKINDLEGVNLEYTVSNITENSNALAYKPNSFKVNGNASDLLEITGAEIGDKFTIAATVSGTNVSVSKDITVLADTAAALYSEKGDNIKDDIDLRKTHFGYDR